MGNKMDVELKEGCVLDINETLIRNIQDRIYMMDKSLSSFAYAVDSMEAICENLLRHIHNSSKDLKDSRARGDKLLEDSLLAETIKECVKDHKFIVLESASKLLHSIIDVGENCTKFHTELAIDRYRVRHNVSEIPYYDQRLQELQAEIKSFRQRYESEKHLVDIFNEREEIYVKEEEEKKIEIVKLRSEKEQLENTLRTKQKENEYLNAKISNIDKQNEKLKEENIEIHKVAVELESKTTSCFEEIQSMIEDSTSAGIQRKITNDLEREQESLKQENMPCENVSQDESHVLLIKDIKCFRDSLDVKMEKIRNQLKHIQNYCETERTSGARNSQGEYNVPGKSQHPISLGEIKELREVPLKANTCNEEIENLKLINDEMKRKQLKLTSENRAIQRKLKTLQKWKTVQVQVYYEIGVRTGAKERDITNMLKLVMKKEYIELEIIELSTPLHVQADIPLLVIRICNYGYFSMFQPIEYWHVLDEFADMHAIAVVTLHCKDGKAVENDTMNSQGITKTCERRFDIGYKSLSKRFDFRERKLRPIIEFILEQESRYQPCEEIST